MNKKLIKIFKYSILSSLLIISSIFVAVELNSKWLGLIIGFGLMILSIPFHLYGKRINRLYILSYLLNSIGAGLSISSYYTLRSIPLDPFYAILSFIVTLVFTLLSLFIINYAFKKKDNMFKLIAIPFIIFIITLIIFWIINEKVVFYNFSFFILIQSFCYLHLGNSIIYAENDFNKKLSFYSYGIYFIITFVVLIILSEGDIGLDFNLSSNSKTKKQKI